MTGKIARAAVILLAAVLPGCSGPFFYRDVIVPTYRQVDPNLGKPPPAPTQP